MPPGAVPLDVGAGAKPWLFNGQWLVVAAFHSTQAPPQLVQWYRQALGEPWALRVDKGRHILVRAQGPEHWTIQLSPDLGPGGVPGTRGLLAVQRPGPLPDPRQAQPAPQVPAGSQVLSHLRTQDGPRASEHLVWRNNLGMLGNTHWLRSHLAGRGLRLERESAPGGVITLWFGGAHREAMAILTQEPSGLSTVVLQVVEAVPINVPLPEPRKAHTPAAGGQAAVEYLVVCAALALALGVGLADGRGVLNEWLTALQTAYLRLAFALSLPQ